MALKIIGGSSHKTFTDAVCKHLGVTETPTLSKVFSNDNRFVRIEETVRGDDVYVIQTQVAPVDVHVMELLLYVRALYETSAGRITVVLPYFPYARSDKKNQPRITISASLVADLIKTAGAGRIIAMDLHAPQIQGFASIPFDHLVAAPEVVAHIKQSWDLTDFVVVAGDAGAAKMTKAYADGLGLPVAMMDKRREGNEEEVVIKSVIGDVEGKHCLIIDDETSSGGTLIKDAEFLTGKAGALSVDACFIHAALGPGAADKLNASPIDRFVTTDSIPLNGNELNNCDVVSVTKKFAECIRRIHSNESIKSLNDL